MSADVYAWEDEDLLWRVTQGLSGVHVEVGFKCDDGRERWKTLGSLSVRAMGKEVIRLRRQLAGKDAP